MASDSNFKKVKYGQNFVPNATTLVSEPGDMDYSTDTGAFNIFDASGPGILVSSSSTNTLINKTINVTLNHIVGTPNTAAQFNATTGDLESSAVSNTELGFLSGVTSSIQTQLNSKQPTITANSIPNSELAQMPAFTIKGNNTGSTANAADLTVAQVNAILPVFTSTLNGLVPLSGGGTVNFLRADGTWQPAGSGSGSVTSVAMTVPSFLSVSGSPITSSGTLAVTLSGTALPAVNGGTAQTSYTTGDILYALATNTLSKLPIGTNGQVLTTTSGLPVWGPAPGTVSAFFASSQVSVNSSPNSSSTFTTFSNSPAFTFTPTISGTYKVYSYAPLQTDTGSAIGVFRIFNTSGGATLLQENQTIQDPAAGNNVLTQPITSVYTLTAGTPYVFDIQGKTNSGNTFLGGSVSPFYMFAELEVTAAPASQFFASSQVTTQSSAITGTTFTTFSNSPAFTFTPSVTGIFKVYSNLALNNNTSSVTATARIFNTSGGATLLQESQAGSLFFSSADLVINTFAQSVYTLTAGTTYVFDIQGKNSTTGAVLLDGANAGAFYMFAESIGGSSGGGSGGINSINGDSTAAQVIAAGTGISVVSSGGTTTITNTGGGSSNPQIAYVQDQKANSTNGGTFTSGAWQVRDLNTLTTANSPSWITNNGTNNFTLTAGTYDIEASAPADNVSTHKAKLVNTTDSTDALIGSSEFSVVAGGGSTQSRSFISGTITISGTKSFQIQHRCTSTFSGSGFGSASFFGTEVEVYTEVKITKIG